VTLTRLDLGADESAVNTAMSSFEARYLRGNGFGEHKNNQRSTGRCLVNKLAYMMHHVPADVTACEQVLVKLLQACLSVDIGQNNRHLTSIKCIK
jgi:hypothetical protein